eukprot:CAMPEP_0201913032 /NCGR_PEP_ID=MMETSP0903-20130614/3550_1 /ASSEMBLY_ACC=CAM_ASM_000552 /TAXON_ID=420261 /ORGANISM="Thalassiosira antarctica, Strain CCMP982" /LENGTH=485 /DNA_ID=CAMNT_0048448129 /DNA_START=39 /DNA_END=1496 /DNA_ORIENTATION=-
MTPRVKEFILGQGHLSQDGFISVQRLVGFWSSPQNIDMTQRIDICGASWYLALIYLRRGFLKVARALTINGAFIHQCIISSIECIKELCSSTDSKESIMLKLSCCAEGFFATESSEKMESFIQRYLPADYEHTMTTFASLSSRNDVMGYVNQISDDYNSTQKYQKRPQDSTGTQMKLILEDGDATEGKRNEFHILPSTNLKAVFTDYAKKRGVSLRSLRFSFANQPLFLSQIGKKTPEDLGMRDQDVIVVHDTSMPQAPQETRSNRSSQRSILTSNQAKLKHRAHSSKAKKTKSQGMDEQQKQVEPIKMERTQAELKIEHSNVLTKIHEELQPQLRQIRQRLNNLLIERSQPKIKSARRHSKSASLPTQSWVDIPCTQCLDGKAGKSYFVVQVGEVGNLYKTRKLPSYSPSNNTPSLDLHGYKGDKALKKLDESLKLWVDTAMKGSYPFVMQVTIICGCGNQILREVVQEWIKSKRNVSNAPKKR